MYKCLNLFLLLLLLQSLPAQNIECLAFYNLENLFNTQDDENRDEDGSAFDPAVVRVLEGSDDDRHEGCQDKNLEDSVLEALGNHFPDGADGRHALAVLAESFG